MTRNGFSAVLCVFGLGIACLAAAQVPAVDPSARLRAVLPADVADRILVTVAAARSRELPADALVNRALKFAARGIPPLDIERSIAEHSARMGVAKGLLEGARGGKAEDTEVEAAAEALRMGVEGAAISDLAKSAPSGRSLAVPLFVIATLADRGLPSDEALARVLERLQARATDAELERLPEQAGAGQQPAAKAGAKGQEKAGSRRPPGAGAAGGAGQGGRPATIPGRGKGPEPKGAP